MRSEFSMPRGEILRQLSESGQWHGEIHYRRSDGSPIPVLSLWVAVREDQGQPLVVVQDNNDLTARHNAERILKEYNARLEETVAQRTAEVTEREHRLSTILSTAADAIITIDQRGTIESVNAAALRMFGYSAEELIGQNVKILMPTPYSVEHDEYITSYLRTGIGKIIGIGREVVARRKDGSVFPVDLAVSEMDHLKKFTGILRDISERKQLQREIVEIGLMEKRRLGETLHDELGQELTALGLLAGGHLESVKESAPADVETATKIRDGLKRLLHQVRDMAQGLSRAEVEPSGLPSVLEDLTAWLSEASKIDFVFEGDVAIDMKDALIANHLYRIAQEACTNALKHSEGNKVRVSLHARDGVATLRIEDDGVGMPVDRSEGLGLKIMHNRAAVIGAKLTIERGKCRGTVVTCVLNQGHPHAIQKYT